MKNTAEQYFVQNFIWKSRRERLLFELTTATRRYDGLSRFCHQSKELLDPARIVLSGTDVDLALLHVDVRENAFLKRCQDEIVVGENVYALGSPYGLSNTFTSGIVSASGREDNGVSYILT